MTKQEKIREGIASIIKDNDTEWREDSDIEEVADLLLTYLNFHGVVIKVDEVKVKDNHRAVHLRKVKGGMVFDKNCKACREGDALVGYLDELFPKRYQRVAVEPLVKE
ncbi:hypothetical protein LCGC14_0384810 [marine sediment metagenome]|uniref:Uncharacterized protein n=1 Tax=marine sediment metagenome TaxID=412755 RepID=A0A0F9T704_9ZZZZ